MTDARNAGDDDDDDDSEEGFRFIPQFDVQHPITADDVSHRRSGKWELLVVAHSSHAALMMRDLYVQSTAERIVVDVAPPALSPLGFILPRPAPPRVLPRPVFSCPIPPL